jgi:hypothetical protein
MCCAGGGRPTVSSSGFAAALVHRAQQGADRFDPFSGERRVVCADLPASVGADRSVWLK